MGFLVDFQIYVAVLGIGVGTIGFAAPWRFKTPESQPDKSNIGPCPDKWDREFHEISDFRKVVSPSWHGIYHIFGPVASKFTCSGFSLGTEKI